MKKYNMTIDDTFLILQLLENCSKNLVNSKEQKTKAKVLLKNLVGKTDE